MYPVIFQRLEHELDFIKGQQSELEDALRPLEASLASAPPPDAERERTYAMAESLDAQLQRMSDDLREVIEHLNTTTSRSVHAVSVGISYPLVLSPTTKLHKSESKTILLLGAKMKATLPLKSVAS